MHIGGGLINERQIFPGLQRKGWEIVDPQFLSVRRQISLIASCAHVAGLDGSAFHTALLAREIRGNFHIFLLRGSARVHARIAQLKGFAQREILLADRAVYLLGTGAERFFRLEDPDVVTDALP
jgi:capsular polysaccharide biosynthesis protein